MPLFSFRQCVGCRTLTLIKLCLCAQLLTLPLVLTQTDESRWFYDVVFFNFLFITSVLCIDGKNLSFATDKHFKPSVGKAVLIVFYFIFFLHPDLQFINQFYSSVAELAGRIKQSLPS